MPVSQEGNGKAVPATAGSQDAGPAEAISMKQRRMFQPTESFKGQKRQPVGIHVEAAGDKDATEGRCTDGAESKRIAKKAKASNTKQTLSPSWNTSKYRGVTRHRRSGRWEAHIWIGKGVNKQMYLGGYEKEEHAAEAYDMAALKTKGFSTVTNFSKDRYRELEGCLGSSTLEEVVTAVRRQSQGFSRGRFEARIGIAGNKHVYLGLFNNEADAARAYDAAVVRIKGSHASTNFSLCDYSRELAEHELKQIELQRPQAFQVMSMALAERLAAGVKLPDASDVALADAKVLTASTEQSRQRWVRAGFPQAQFETLFASLQQLRGVAGPVATPMPFKLISDAPVAVGDAAQAPPPVLPLSDPSSASSTALLGAAAGHSGVVAPVSTADTSTTRTASTPAPHSLPAVAVLPLRSSSAPHPAAPGPAAAEASTPTTLPDHASAASVSVLKGSASLAATVLQQTMPIAHSPFGMFPGHAISIAVPGSVPAAPGTGMGDPQFMQLYLQQLALERGVGVPSLGMHVGSGMAMMGAAAAPLGGLTAAAGGMDVSGLTWSAGLGGGTQVVGAESESAPLLTRSLRSGVLLARDGHSMMHHPLHQQRGFHQAGGGGGVWTLRQPHGMASAQHAGPTLEYAPVLLGDPLAGQAAIVPGGGLPLHGGVGLAVSGGSIHAPSAFTQVAGGGLVQLPHVSPQVHLQSPPQGGRSAP